MEKILSAVFSEESEETNGKINDQLSPRFTACNAQERSLSITFCAQEWMLNPNGTLHGGLISTTLDMGATVLCRYLAKKRIMVTAQLSVNFLRAIRKDEFFTVHVAADHLGRRSTMVHAWISVGDSEKPAATATAVLM